MNTAPTIDSVDKPKHGRFSGEGFLSAMVAILSILTAVVAFHASRLDSQSSENESIAMQMLIESNTVYLSALQDVIYDFQLYDQWVFEEDPEKIDYFYSSFTPELQESIERSDGAVDDQYFVDMFGDSDGQYQDAIDLFVSSDTVGNQADNLQLVMMLFALGLAFAGWASLLDESQQTRTMFGLFSLVMLIIGIGMYGWFLV